MIKTGCQMSYSLPESPFGEGRHGSDYEHNV